MASKAPAYDLNLAALSDEVLLVLAQECDWKGAWDELLGRHLPAVKELIAGWAHKARLSPQDVEDAQQQAFFAVREAIMDYDTQQLVNDPVRCRFRSFLGTRVESRYRDFLRALRQRESHLDRSVRVDSPAGARPPRSPRSARVSDPAAPRPTAGFADPKAADPAATAEEHEALARLAKALSQLDKTDRECWELRVSGMKLRAIAERLGLSYDKAKRWHRGLPGKLAALMKRMGE